MVVKQVLLILSVVIIEAALAGPSVGYFDKNNDIEVVPDIHKYNIFDIPAVDDNDVAENEAGTEANIQEHSIEGANIESRDKELSDNYNVAEEDNTKLMEEQLAKLKKQLNAVNNKLEELYDTLNSRVDDSLEQLNNVVTKRMNEIEEKFTAKIDVLIDAVMSTRESDTVEPTTDSDVVEPITESDVVEPTTDSDTVKPTSESNFEEPSSESNDVESTSESDAAKSTGESKASEWWAPFCGGHESFSEARSWGPGDIPPVDMFDMLLERETECEQRLVPPYDRQPFRWSWPDESSLTRHWSPYWYDGSSGERSTERSAGAGPRLQQRLAVRTVGAGRADIKIYWNDERKYYFAFSNSSNTLEFIRYSPWELLWSFNLPPPTPTTPIPPTSTPTPPTTPAPPRPEHYLPLYFSIEPEYIRWSVGCGGALHSWPVTTTARDTLKLEIETSAFPAKMFYNCPLH